MFTFMPKEMKFFDLFDKQVSNLLDGAVLFSKIINEPAITRDNVDKMHDIEHIGDELNHNIVNTLNESFITPFDREDILALANNMDNVIDALHMITNRYYIYQLFTPGEEAKKFAFLIESSVRALKKAVTSLRSNKNMKETIKECVEINRLENLADEIRDEAITKLFKTPNPDPIMIIKHKELYEAEESVTDYCEHVANIVESILVKNN